MDPNANLAEQETLLGSESREDRARLRELREALDVWILRGGFYPDRKAHPDAWKAFIRWNKQRAKFQDLYR